MQSASSASQSLRPLSEVKRVFLLRELLMLAWMALVQRAKLYRTGLKLHSKEVDRFRQSVKRYVFDELVPTYRSGCTAAQHVRNIDDLVKHATTAGRGLLGPRGYKFGVAQKLLNLFLKYLWCLGELEIPPPHCPVDRMVIEMTALGAKVNWTEITTHAKYAEVIAAIDTVAKEEELKIAEWELRHYARR